MGLLDHRDLVGQLIEFLGASHWYVGFSGGLDSTVLLYLLHRYRKENDAVPALSAVHVNHGLQVASNDWQHHCEAVCRTLGIECHSMGVNVAVQGSGEEAARDARYRAFAELLQPGAVLFLAHHLDDQVETFLLRLLRGAGVQGLAAMPPRRALGAGELARPLLDVERSALQEYARHHALEHIEDPSNLDTAMGRNFMRQRVLPLVNERWPAYRQSIARASAHLASAAPLLAEIPETVCSVMGDPGLALDTLTSVTPDVAANRLRAWLRSRGYKTPDCASLSEFLRQVQEAKGHARPRLDSGQYALQRHQNAVYLVPRFQGTPPPQPLQLFPGHWLHVPGVGSLSLLASAQDGLQLATDDNVELRWRRGGERCRPIGRGGSVSLKSLLQEMGVPAWWRDRVPLVFFNDELLLVGDLVCCESVRGAVVNGRDWQFVWERAAELC
ncbi:MAG: tRNA lysidine(34) synthetase TilS [Halioglobus sp.]|nr:tRNA lysidine(34) synthetase TilS [Halioglobus sp.]